MKHLVSVSGSTLVLVIVLLTETKDLRDLSRSEFFLEKVCTKLLT